MLFLNSDQKQKNQNQNQTQSDTEAAEFLKTVSGREDPDFVNQNAATVKFPSRIQD